MNTDSQFMHPEGGPKTAFDLYLDSCSPLTFGQWKLSPEQVEHCERWFGPARKGDEQLLRRAA